MILRTARPASGSHSQSGLAASIHETIAQITARLGVRAGSTARALWRLSRNERATSGGLPEKAITVTNGRGAVARFVVEIAVTPAEREKGLMFRRSLAANSGMLFMFPKAEVVDFWMKDTIVPLDMIFIRANGVVDSIARDQPPLSLANTFSAGPVIAALEIRAGSSDRLGLKAGDKVSVADPIVGIRCRP